MWFIYNLKNIFTLIIYQQNIYYLLNRFKFILLYTYCIIVCIIMVIDYTKIIIIIYILSYFFFLIIIYYLYNFSEFC